MEAGAAPAAKWHPNTVRMCKLLRARMRKQGVGALGFGKDVAGGARRTKAANMFWEVRLCVWVCAFVLCGCVFVFVDSTDLTLTDTTLFYRTHTTGAAAQDVGLHRGAAGRGALCRGRDQPGRALRGAHPGVMNERGASSGARYKKGGRARVRVRRLLRIGRRCIIIIWQPMK